MRFIYNIKNTGKIFGSSKNEYLKAPSFLRTSDMKVKHSQTLNLQKSAVKPKSSHKRGGLLDMLNFNNIEMDSDRSMLLMMIALLSGNGNESDELLMLALMYIML